MKDIHGDPIRRRDLVCADDKKNNLLHKGLSYHARG